MKKLNVWLISDEKYIYLDMYINQIRYDKKLCIHVQKHLSIKQIKVENLRDVENEGTPDIIMIDMGCIAWNNNWYPEGFPDLVKFATKHSSSIICIMSYVNCWAEDTKNALSDALQNEVVVEFTGNGDKAIIEYLSEKVFKYFPINNQKDE